MPEAKMMLMEVIEDERRSGQPKATCELSNLLPATQVDDFQLGEREYR